MIMQIASVNKSENVIPVLFILIILIIFLFYASTRMPPQSFWDDLIVTMVAVIIGILFGLWADRLSNTRNRQEKFQEAREKEKHLLLLVKKELEYTRDKFFERKGNFENLPIQPFKMSFWESVSVSGITEVIDDLEVLNGITSAYYIIELVANLEDQLYKAIRGINVRYENGKLASQELLQDARKFDQVLEERINFALQIIEQRVKKI